MNCSENEIVNLGLFAKEVNKECSYIREHMYKTMFKKESSIYEYCLKIKNFFMKSIEEQQVYVQSIYLQSKETDYVYNLIKILKQKVRQLQSQKVILKEDNNNIFFDKKVEIDWLDLNLSFIPLNSGLFIGCENDTIHKMIPNLIKKYNSDLKSERSLIQFEKKNRKRRM